MSHTGRGSSTLSDRLKDQGITISYCGENCAHGHITVHAVVEGWMKSEGHRKNMLNPAYTHIGWGKAGDGWGTYWAQDFAKL